MSTGETSIDRRVSTGETSIDRRGEPSPPRASDRNTDRAVAAALTLGALAIWLAGFTTAGVHGNDASDYAQMGREIVRGHGFATLHAFPRHLAFFAQQGLLDGPHWPNLYRYPLPTVLAAAAQLLIPVPWVAAVVPCGLAWVAAAPLTYLLARRACSRPVAALVAVLLLSDPQIFASAYSGYTETVAIALLLGACLLATRPHPTRVSAAACGVLCGLALLNRTQAALNLPLAVLLVALFAPARRRLAHAAIVCAAFAITLLPWALRDVAVVGAPLFSLNSSRNLVLDGGVDVDLRLAEPTGVGDVLARHGRAVVRAKLGDVGKRAAEIGEWSARLPGLAYAVLTLACFAGAWAQRSRAPAAARLAAAAALFLTINFALLTLTIENERLYLPVRPLLWIGGAAVIASALAGGGVADGRVRQARIAVAVLVCALAAVQLGGVASWIASARTRPDPTAEGLRALCAELAPDAVVVSDRSAQIALHCGLRSVRLPERPGDLIAIDDRLVRIDQIVLSPLAFRRGRYPARAWRGGAVLDSPPLSARFALESTLADGTRIYGGRAHRPDDRGGGTAAGGA